MKSWIAAAKRELRRGSFSVVELADGRVWVAGGETSERIALSSTELWSPRTDQWSAGPELDTARTAHFGVRLASGQVLIGGGRDAEGDRLDSVALWDAELNHKPRKLDPLLASRESATALALKDGGAIVAGGDASSEAHLSVELLSEGTGEWSEADPLPGIAELFGAAVLPDGRVIVAGGASRAGWANDGGVHYRQESVRSMRIFSPLHGRWSAGEEMITARMDHRLVVLFDGRVLVTGGLRAGEFLASAEIWDWRSERWEAAGSMAHGRAQHAMCALPDGRVLVAGGSSADGIRRETELWDPDNGAFTPGPSLLEPRIGHSAIGLRDGRVLVIGGSGRGGLLATAELLVL